MNLFKPSKLLRLLRLAWKLPRNDVNKGLFDRNKVQRISTTLFLTVIVLAILILAGCTKKSQTPVYKGKPVKIGFQVCNSKQETLTRFKPMVAYLSRETGRKFEIELIDTHDMDAVAGLENLDFFHTNSLAYVVLNRNHGAQVFLGEKRGKDGAFTTGGIVVRKDSKIKTLKDLKGKSMIFGPMLAPSAYMAQYNLMMDAGLDPELDLSFYTIPDGSFKHEKVAYGLFFDKFDAAAMPMIDFELMIKEAKIKRSDFRVIAESKKFPYCNFSAGQGTDEELVSEVKEALLKLDKNTTVEVDGETVKVLKAAWLDGYQDIDDKDFDVIRTMAKRADMPPYQNYGNLDPGQDQH